jgi:hypothetical protein
MVYARGPVVFCAKAASSPHLREGREMATTVAPAKTRDVVRETDHLAKSRKQTAEQEENTSGEGRQQTIEL